MEDELKISDEKRSDVIFLCQSQSAWPKLGLANISSLVAISVSTGRQSS
jgi:hypothetical protein